MMWIKWKFGLVFLEIVLILTQDMCMVCANVQMAQKSFWAYLMELLRDVGQLEDRFALLGEVVKLGAK
jgi:hypothetical protein